MNDLKDSPNRLIEFIKVWVRRALSISLYVCCFGLLLVLFPGLFPLAVITDLIRKKSWILTRAVIFFPYYFACEVLGIIVGLVLWIAYLFIRDAEKFLDWNFALQRWWVNALAQGAKKLFNFQVDVEGTDELTRGPVIVFARHVSVADALLPAFFIANPNGVRLRYVLKKQLLWDPCLDIVGNRLPNVFVRRDAGEAYVVNRLMHDLTPRDGVMIYPEGTRFSRIKQQIILEKIKAKGEWRLYEQASQLKHTLPPRLGGALNLLAMNENADVIFCAHAGFDGVVDLRDFLNGSLISRTVKIKFYRVPFAEIPTTREAQINWLMNNWKAIDEWIGQQLMKEKSVVRVQR
ncbi:MAG: 1-acyl-sn-glycerol-3-phosphate acyltransferase [Acidobacteriota bacterium]